MHEGKRESFEFEYVSKLGLVKECNGLVHIIVR
jgi:hypothetical protein